MLRFIENTGFFTINSVQSISDIFTISIQVLTRIFHRKSYNSATLSVLVNQIYFTAVQILPLFLGISIILGALIIGIVFQTIKKFGLDDYIGNIFMGFIITELSPFVTVFLIALRSGSAINTEIAVMKVNKELETLRIFKIDQINYLFFPRILSGMISVVLLNGLFSFAFLTSGLLFSKIIFGMGLNTYSTLLINSISLNNMLIIIMKCLTFGFFITAIPIIYGKKVFNDLTSIPIAVLNGMIRVFTAIITIEVFSLIAQFI